MSKAGKGKKGPVGVLLVTHGGFGRDLLASAEIILGPQENKNFVSVDVTRSVDETVEAIRAALEGLNSGAGVLVLTDLFGGSPTTLSLSLLKSHPIEVVTGVNLPMLITAFQGRSQELSDLASRVREAGQQGIKVAGEMLKRKVANA